MMREKGSVIDALRKTKQGKLVYDRHCLTKSGAKVFLDEIASQITCLSVVPPSSPNAEIQTEKAETPSPFNVGKSSISASTAEKTISLSSSSPPFSPKRAGQTLNSGSDTCLVELSILEYEDERAQNVKAVVEAKRAYSENHYSLIQQGIEQQFQLLFRRVQLETQRKDLELQNEDETQLKEIKEKELKLQEHHKIRAKRLNAKMREAELRQKQLELLEQKRLQEQDERRWKQLEGYQMEFHNIVQQTIESLQSCKHHKYLQTPPTKWLEQLKKLADSIDQLVITNKKNDITKDHLNEAQQLLEKMKATFQEVTSDINEAEIKYEKEIEEAEKHVSVDIKTDEEIMSVPESTFINVTKDTKPNVKMDTKVESTAVSEEKELKSAVESCATFSSLKEYVRLKENLKEWQQSYQPLATSLELKKYRFDLQKAVNVPINAISPVSSTHLRDKLHRLESLISGYPVDVGGKRIKSSDHPLAKAFCKDLMAKKFVMQGEGQIASKFESAFAIAAVIVGIWCSFPDIGDLLLAHFYLKCPYLLPYYPPYEKDQSEEDYFKSLGYLNLDGEVEKQDKFLKRMSGITRLYAAVIQSSVPPWYSGSHPHGIEYGWKWLTQILNLEPRPDITATLLLDFLEVTGHTMQRMYGKQFQKLLHALCKDYFPKIEKVTPLGSGGPVARLETFLQNAIKRGRISPPNGVLSNYFWSSS